ncbi:MAG: 16S rRNA (guanine(966)-N(2))-methyltransferase RsmD [Ruminococcaceae bacterium]|nr:16S rRNA (guanine(966)-N(2))-methyltransferase RsmD [Oscillospiraceae bacterium]
MRVISGTARGKKLLSLEGLDTRPTTDRVKESVFNIIMSYVRDAAVLDAFAGSGALGIEALSRGAVHCTFVEKSRAALEVLRKNLEGTRLSDKAAVRQADTLEFLRAERGTFDLIFLDPPYDGGLYGPVMELIAERGLLSADGVLVVEKRAETVLAVPDGLTCIKERKYGKTAIAVYTSRKEDAI